MANFCIKTTLKPERCRLNLQNRQSENQLSDKHPCSNSSGYTVYGRAARIDKRLTSSVMNDNNNKNPIRSFRDLDVFQNAYRAMLTVHKQILPKLPSNEKFDLTDQLSRSTKAVPRLIAEGYTKKHQKAGFQKYIDDAHTEANETIVGLEQCKDLYNIDSDLCTKLVDDYDKIARQLFNLAEAWDKFKNRRRTTPPPDDTRGADEQPFTLHL